MTTTSLHRPVLLREALGSTLRALRMERGLTLREVSALSTVSLGYLSEVERGHKEASSELLAAVCHALGVTLSDVLLRTAEATHPVPTLRAA